jgi:thymidylate synthase
MNIEKQYLDLLKDILQNGIIKKDRTGTGTISVFGRQLRHKMSEGFPLLTTKKMYFKGIVTELLWFLRGDTNIKFLHDNDCHIWDGDYNKSGRIDGELGPIYGFQWRKWGKKITNDSNKQILHEGYDQITNLIKDLQNNPDSRRLMVSAWNVSDIDKMTLPPCHYGFQVYTRELTLKERFEIWDRLEDKDVLDFPIGDKMNDEIYHSVLSDLHIPRRAISLMYNTRSQDLPLGTPFNIASYALLLEILAKMVNMVPDELISNMGDCHIYLNQIDGIKEQIQREPYQLPKLKFSKSLDFVNGINNFLNSSNPSDFTTEDYLYHPSIKIPLSN